MGRFIESIRNWLSPKRSPQDLIIHLKTFSELLDINRQELEQKAEEHRQKALKYLKMGHREQAKKYLKLYHEYLTKAMSIDEYKASIDALTFQLEQAQIMDQAVKVISEVRVMLKDILVSMPSLKRITNEAEKINKMVEQIEGVKEEVLTAVKPKVSAKEISDEELEAELDQLEESLGITIKEAEEIEFPEPLEEEINKVKEKLKKLKES
ncbi:MAG: Snf7 family protein [Candidatus Asgardarchaeia archaeon]|nr:Snf7 family protein [Candidatus Odinarchaeota archaeon]